MVDDVDPAAIWIASLYLGVYVVGASYALFDDERWLLGSAVGYAILIAASAYWTLELVEIEQTIHHDSDTGR